MGDFLYLTPITISKKISNKTDFIRLCHDAAVPGISCYSIPVVIAVIAVLQYQVGFQHERAVVYSI